GGSNSGFAVSNSRRRFAETVEIIIIGSAFHIRFAADFTDKTLHRAPVGSIIHQHEMQADLQWLPLALILLLEGCAEGLIGTFFKLRALSRLFLAAGMAHIKIIVH